MGWYGVYEQRMVKREGESGELIRSDVQFSTEIYEDERNVERYSEMNKDVQIFSEMLRYS